MPELRIALLGAGVDSLVLSGSARPLAVGETRSVGELQGELRVEFLQEQKGLSKKELALTVSISFATGVPSSLVATWIWEQLTDEGARTVVLELDEDMEEPADLPELEGLIQRALREERGPRLSSDEG